MANKRVKTEASSSKDAGLAYGHLQCHNGRHLSAERKAELEATALKLATSGKGITACDESAGTIGTRFEAVGVENTAENRRIYRQMLFSNGSEYLCGAILDPETLTQANDKGKLFPAALAEDFNIVPGVKPHLKTYTLPGTGGDTVMQVSKCGG